MTTTWTQRGLVLAVLLAVAPGATARDRDGADWPQWRGPDRTGVSMETGWSAVGQTEPLWTKELGLGHSSFVIAAGRVYTLGHDADAGLDAVYCLDASNGDELWRHAYESDLWDNAHDGGTLTTPTVVGDVVYTSNREGKVFCFDAENGDVRWARDVRSEMGLEPPIWGFSASPLLVDDRVVMNVDRVAAFDRHTGEEVWITDKKYGISYATPAAFELDGREYLASLSGDGLLVLDRTDGSEVAFYPWVKQPQIYPMTPVIIGDRIFISAGYDRGCAMLQLVDDRLEELWASRVMRNKMSGSVLWEGHLFGFDESILKCIDLDGNERWRKRGLGTGSMSIVGGRMIILDGKGQVIVAEANPEAYVELSRQEVLDDGTSWSTPVLSHGRVYCRSSLGQMACLDYGASTASTVATGTRPMGLPDAPSIIARHVAIVGGAGSLETVTSVSMRGAGESLVNTVRAGAVEVAWSAARGFSWQGDSGFQFGHNADIGWLVGPRSRPSALKDESLQAIREAGDLARLFDPAASYAEMRATKATVFDNRDCYAIEATTAEGHARTLYFEVDSGLYAGHQGDGIHMWTVRDYRDFDGLMLPAQWSFYEPANGEVVSATFDTVVVNDPIEADRFAVPEIVLLFARSPEEQAIANKRLEKIHAGILGAWDSVDSPPDDPPTSFEVDEGFLLFMRGDGEPSYLTEPDDDGIFAIIGSEFVTFSPERNDAGVVTAIQIHVGGAPRMRLVRGEE